jgi:hypothetical protein
MLRTPSASPGGRVFVSLEVPTRSSRPDAAGGIRACFQEMRCQSTARDHCEGGPTAGVRRCVGSSAV